MHNKSFLEPDVLGVLKKAQIIFHPSCVVAGGYLRDRVYGIPYKDVNIFTINAQRTGTFTRNIEENFPRSLGMEECSCEYEEKDVLGGPRISFNYEGKKYTISFLGYPVMEYVKRYFDFTINCIWDAGDEQLTQNTRAWDATNRSHHIKFLASPKEYHPETLLVLQNKLNYLFSKLEGFSIYPPHKQELEECLERYKKTTSLYRPKKFTIRTTNEEPFFNAEWVQGGAIAQQEPQAVILDDLVAPTPGRLADDDFLRANELPRAR